MTSNRQLFLKHLGQTSENPYLLEIEKAKDIYLYGTKGEKYIDLISGVSVSNLGHNNEIIKNAIIEQLEKHAHIMVYGEYVQKVQVELAGEIKKLLPSYMDSVFFVNSGSEAVEAALKLAKKYTEKNKIFSFKNSYHGSTHGALSVTGNENLKQAYRPLLPEVFHLDYNYMDSIDSIDSETACVIVEAIQAEAGIRIPSNVFLEKLDKKCKQNNALLIIDEVQTGFGRTGKMFGFNHFDIEPDIICMAKALGSGMPIGAIAANKNIMKSFSSNPALGHITTFGGHPVSAAAALAGIKILKNNNHVDEVTEKGNLFKNSLKSNLIKKVRGTGLLLAVELGSFDIVLSFIKKGIENGIVTDWFLFDDKSFRIAPPLIITNEQITEACRLINKTLKEL